MTFYTEKNCRFNAAQINQEPSDLTYKVASKYSFCLLFIQIGLRYLRCNIRFDSFNFETSTMIGFFLCQWNKPSGCAWNNIIYTA